MGNATNFGVLFDVKQKTSETKESKKERRRGDDSNRLHGCYMDRNQKLLNFFDIKNIREYTSTRLTTINKLDNAVLYYLL